MPLFGTRGAASVTGFGGLAKLGYLLRNSLRFRASNSNYLNRTFGTPTNNKVWTWSAWVKRGSLSLADADHLFMGTPTDVGGNPSTYARLVFETDGTLRLQSASSASEAFTSSAVFRDPAAWYHIVLYMDAVNTTVRCYVNGTEIAYASRSNPTNTNTAINGSGNYHRMGFFRTAEPRPMDGYMAEVNFIDGQALTPSSFGKTDAVTGQWIPIKYSGTYGTNGFYLNFTDASAATAAAIGKDSSGNGNNWTPNNISVTAGATYDSMTDVPTLTSATAANYCVLNILDGTNMSYLTVSNANLTYSASANANGWRAIRGTIGVTTGKYRFSVYGTIGASTRMQLGLCTSDTDLGGYNASQNVGVQYNPYDANVAVNGSLTSYGSTQRITAVFDFIFDATTGKCWVAVNGTLLGGNPDAGTGEMATFTTTSTVFPVTQAYGSSWDVNFGQRPWDYTIATASGFKSLNTYNLP